MNEAIHSGERQGERTLSRNHPNWWERLLVFGWLVAVYLARHLLVSRIESAQIQMYVAQPLLWLSLAALVVWLWQQGGKEDSLKGNPVVIGSAAAFAVFETALLFLAGLFFGLGNSPYARGALDIALNLWYLITGLVGLELARWYLVSRLTRRMRGVGVAIIWLLFVLVLVAPAAYVQLDSPSSTLRFAGGRLLPLAGEGLLATYLAMAGGPLASIAYRGVLDLVEWVSPVLPDLPFLVRAFLGVVVPAIGLFIVQWFFFGEPEEAKVAEVAEKKGSSPLLWIIVVLFGATLVWFNTGAFGVQPTLVSGFSMKPTFVAGDVAITREAPEESIQVDDIIRFRQNGVFVLHRVLEVREGASERVFITQGDNNNTEDPPVPASALAGKVILIAPKVGWPAIWVRQAIQAVGELIS